MAVGSRVWRSELPPLAFLERSASVFRQRTAVIDGERHYSYAELGARVNQLADALRAGSVVPSDRVAILAPNSAPMIEAHFGVPMAGAIMVPINVRLSPDEVAYILDHSGARMLLGGNEFAPLIAHAYERLGRALPTVWLSRLAGGNDLPAEARPGDTPYETFLATGSPEAFPWSLDPEEGEDATISINYTSCTTGPPKAEMYHHPC